MKTKKSDEFIQRALSVSRTRFAVVGKGGTWTFFEGQDLAKAAADPGETLIKAFCKRAQQTLSIRVVGGADEIKLLKNKVFPDQLAGNAELLSFKALGADEGRELDQLLAEVDGPLAEQVGRLGNPPRDAAVALLNQVRDLANDGEPGPARAKALELKRLLATVPPPRPKSPAPERPSQPGTPPPRPTAPLPTDGRRADGQAADGTRPQRAWQAARPTAEADGGLAAARQPLERLLAQVQHLQPTVGEPHAGRLQRVERLINEGLGKNAADAMARDHANCERAFQMIVAAIQAERAATAEAGADDDGQTDTSTESTTQPDNQIPDVEQQLLAALGAQSESPPQFKQVWDELWSDYMHFEELDDEAEKLRGFRDLLDEALQVKAAAEQQMLAIRQVNKDVADIKALLAELGFPPPHPDLQDLRARFQQVKQDVLDTDAAPPSVRAAAGLLAELKAMPEIQQIQRESSEKTTQAVSRIRTLQPADLAALDVGQRIELLLALRRGGGRTDKVCREAMIKLHKATPLEKGFKTKDKAMRRDVEDALVGNKVLREARREWPSYKDDVDQKVAALQEALTLQCAAMRTAWGVDVPVPTITTFAAGPQGFDEVTGEALYECGGFEPGTGRISINTEASAFDDFDKTLDTIIHENTHNFQQALVADLEAGRIDKDREPEKYQQAVLFQLNMPPLGYLEPGDAEDTTDGDAYELQSTERHAWAAGKGAGRLSTRFQIEDLREEEAAERLARARADGGVTRGHLAMMAMMMERLAPGFRGLDAVQQRLDNALAGDSAEAIVDAMDAALAAIETLTD